MCAPNLSTPCIGVMSIFSLLLAQAHLRIMNPDGADCPPIDFSIREGSPEGLVEKLPPGAPGLAKILLVVTDEGGHHVRRTLHDITARLLGVEMPWLPSIRERKKLALEYAQV